MVADRGMRATIAHVKNTRLAVTRYLSGQPLSSLEGVKLVRGFPLWIISYLDHFPNLDRDEARYLLTLLVALRDILLPTVFDKEPIVSTWKGSVPAISEKEHKLIKKQLGLKKTTVKFESFHISTKKGPNGQAIITSTVDFDALPADLIEDLLLLADSPGNDSLRKVQRAKLEQPGWYNLWRELSEFEGVSKIRKLSCISDKEGKSRTIAIFDYWSQTVLKPYHDCFNAILRKLENDCTFNQNQFTKCLPSMTGERVFHSIDLKNATDRMPVAFQKKVIAAVIGRSKADAWERVLTSHGFTYGKESDIYYMTGQPMGAYSSWPVMAITHHYIVRLAALKVREKDFKDYAILGDDLVIANTAVANSYREILGILDMPISEQKTHTSPHFYEFAKRYVYHGEEISPFQLSSLKSVHGKYFLLQNFLENQSLHGWSLDRCLIPGLIQNIYNVFGKTRQGASCWKLYDIFESLTLIKKCDKVDSSMYEKMSLHFGLPKVFSPEYASSFSEEAIRVIRRGMIQDDINKVYTEIREISELLENKYNSYVEGLVDQTNIEQIRMWHPIVVASEQRLIDALCAYTKAWDPDLTIKELMEFEGISTSMVRRDAFSVRASKSILLATSQMVKRLITEVKKQYENLNS